MGLLMPLHRDAAGRGQGAAGQGNVSVLSIPRLLPLAVLACQTALPEGQLRQPAPSPAQSRLQAQQHDSAVESSRRPRKVEELLLHARLS